MSEYGTWNTHDSDVDTNLARSSLKQKPWTTNMNPELPRISPNTIVLLFLNLIVSFGFAGRVKWREAKGRRDRGTPAIGGARPGADRCPRHPLQVGDSANGQDGTRGGADLTWEKDAPCPWRPPIWCVTGHH